MKTNKLLFLLLTFLFFMPSDIGAYDLVAQDHTLIMETGVKNIDFILSVLPSSKFQSAGEVLAAMLSLQNVESDVKHKIEVALQFLPKIEPIETKLSVTEREAIDVIIKQIDRCSTLPEMATTLRTIKDSNEYNQIEGINTGIEFAINILNDGEGTIYNQDWLSQNSPLGGENYINWKKIAQRDIEGAIGGAISGAIVGALGGPGGAVGGATSGAGVGATSMSVVALVGEAGRSSLGPSND